VTVTETVTAEPPPVAEPGSVDQDGLPLDEMPDPAGEGTMHAFGEEPGYSRENPASVGDTLALGDWDVVIGDVTTGDDARQFYSDYPPDQQNDIIGEGNTLVSFEVTATRYAPGSGEPSMDISTTWLSPEGAEVGGSCAMATNEADGPDWGMGTGEAFEGASLTGRDNLCIPDDTLDGGLLAVSDLFGGRMFIDVS